MVGTKRALIAYIETLPDDTTKYTIEKYREKRSKNANDYFWVLVDKIKDVMGLSKTEVHNWLISDYGARDKELGEFILRDDVDWRKLNNLHLRPTGATRVLDNGRLYHVYHVMRGSKTYNSAEMSRLINGAINEAKEIGIPESELLTENEKLRLIALWGQNNG